MSKLACKWRSVIANNAACDQKAIGVESSNHLLNPLGDLNAQAGICDLIQPIQNDEAVTGFNHVAQVSSEFGS